MDKAYIHSLATPICPKVLGKQLLPLSLGHLFILQASDSPLLTEGEVTLGDLAFCVWCCSMEFPEVQAKLAGIRTEKDMLKLQKSVFKWGKKNPLKKLNVEEIANQIADYLGDFIQAPTRWESKEDKQAKVPWMLSVATCLMMHGGFEEERAWTMPVPLALSMYSAIGEALGDESLLTEEEYKTING